MDTTKIDLIPYLNFQGNCEEALNMYKTVFGGSFEVVQRYDNPAMNAPKEYQNRVLHGILKFGDITMYASDVFPGHETGKTFSNVALSLSLKDLEKAKQIFNQLSEGGKVNVPFEKQFWGAWHGNFIDRFSITWMVNVE